MLGDLNLQSFISFQIVSMVFLLTLSLLYWSYISSMHLTLNSKHTFPFCLWRTLFSVSVQSCRLSLVKHFLTMASLNSGVARTDVSAPASVKESHIFLFIFLYVALGEKNVNTPVLDHLHFCPKDFFSPYLFDELILVPRMFPKHGQHQVEQ